ncbi:MAG: CoA transferase [Dehalococcoidia bacterium]|nr:CoA transferase [Dehalococcoidia bacterium]
MATGPLAGIRVLEFSQIVAAPVCGMHLADMGADVIKIEPLEGEQTRRSGSVVPGESKGFQALNRGKRSLVVDLSNPRGQELIWKLTPRTDVVSINYRLGVAERLRIDYQTLSGIRPDLVYWQNTGFGDEGPEKFRAGSDIVAQAYSGLMALDEKVDDDGAPNLIASPIADIASGIAAAMGISAALFHRAQTGKGQFLTTSLLRSSLSLLGATVMREPVHDSILRDPMMGRVEHIRSEGGTWEEILEARRTGAQLAAAFRLYYGAYRAKGGAVVLGALTRANRDAMRRVLAIDENYDADPNYNAQDPQQVAAAAEWKRIIRAKFLTRTADEWVADFDQAGVPVSAVRVPEELAEDPQVLADGMITHLEHSVTGPQRVVGPILKMSETPTATPRSAPALGEHSVEVLRDFGVDESHIRELCQDRIIFDRNE